MTYGYGFLAYKVTIGIYTTIIFPKFNKGVWRINLTNEGRSKGEKQMYIEINQQQ